MLCDPLFKLLLGEEFLCLAVGDANDDLVRWHLVVMTMINMMIIVILLNSTVDRFLWIWKLDVPKSDGIRTPSLEGPIAVRKLGAFSSTE